MFAGKKIYKGSYICEHRTTAVHMGESELRCKRLTMNRMGRAAASFRHKSQLVKSQVCRMTFLFLHHTMHKVLKSITRSCRDEGVIGCMGIPSAYPSTHSP